MEPGLKLKIDRISKNIKATDIANHLGVSKAYISLMENGNRKIPSDTQYKWLQYIEKKEV